MERGVSRLKVTLNIDSEYKETKVTIETPILDNSVQEILEFIKGRETGFLVGKVEEMQYILKPSDIHYFHTEKEGVIAVTATDPID